MKDYERIRQTGEYRASRRAAMFPDEEPDDDALQAGVLHARNERQANEERTEAKRRKGTLPREGE